MIIGGLSPEITPLLVMFISRPCKLSPESSSLSETSPLIPQFFRKRDLNFWFQSWPHFGTHFYRRPRSQNDPKIVQKLIQQVIQIWTYVWPLLEPLLGPFWGSQDRPKRRQDEPKRCAESFKVATWRHPKAILRALKTQQKYQKMIWTCNLLDQCVSHFGSQSCLKN